MFNLKQAYLERVQHLKDYSKNIKYDVDKFKIFLLIFCMLYVQCIILMLVLTAAACGVYQSNVQKDGSLALYALAVTTVNVILIMMGTAIFGIYAALKLSRFVLACHGIGLCTVIILKFMLAIAFFIAIGGAVEDNQQNVMKILESKDEGRIASAQNELECCGLEDYRYFGRTIPDSCCPKIVETCNSHYAYVDGCLFKVGQLTRVPAIVTGVSMILMVLLELLGLAITYGLVKSITLKEGVIDFKQMFKEKLELVNSTVAKPFLKDGFASNMFEALKKKAQQSFDDVDEEEKDEKDHKTTTVKRHKFASNMFDTIKKSLDFDDGDDDDDDDERPAEKAMDSSAMEHPTTTDILIVQIQNSQEATEQTFSMPTSIPRNK